MGNNYPINNSLEYLFIPFDLLGIDQSMVVYTKVFHHVIPIRWSNNLSKVDNLICRNMTNVSFIIPFKSTCLSPGGNEKLVKRNGVVSSGNMMIAVWYVITVLQTDRVGDEWVLPLPTWSLAEEIWWLLYDISLLCFRQIVLGINGCFLYPRGC